VLILPRPLPQTQMVPNECAICLENYQVGEVIAWSSKKSCPHAFHRECVTKYLANVQEENYAPCPSCRQNFANPSTPNEKQPENDVEATIEMTAASNIIPTL
jgi:hypothetical protein